MEFGVGRSDVHIEIKLKRFARNRKLDELQSAFVEGIELFGYSRFELFIAERIVFKLVVSVLKDFVGGEHFLRKALVYVFRLIGSGGIDYRFRVHIRKGGGSVRSGDFFFRFFRFFAEFFFLGNLFYRLRYFFDFFRRFLRLFDRRLFGKNNSAFLVYVGFFDSCEILLFNVFGFHKNKPPLKNLPHFMRRSFLRPYTLVYVYYYI